MPSTSMSGRPGGLTFAGGRPLPMVRSSGQSGVGAMGNNRTHFSNKSSRIDTAAVASLEPVVPLEKSANRWVASRASKRRVAIDLNSPEIVDRKVRSLLNKFSMENFESISNQIIAWANKSEREKDARTLIQVVRLVFERATDDAAWSEMYARLCRKMMEEISPNVQDDGIRNAEGKPISGGLLFRKFLLNRCNEDFERGWTQKELTAAAALVKVTEDQAVKDANEKEENKEAGESALYSDEYYAAQKAKRQCLGLGLVKFIGELFKFQMLTERIMHECIKKLLSNVDKPEEEEIESLCMLLTTVGQMLDTPKARGHMDVYFSRMKELAKSNDVSSRMQSMLQDVIYLRERRWTSCNVASAGKLTMSKEQAERKIAKDCKEFFTVRDLAEEEEYFSALPSEHRHILVEKLVMSVVKAKEADAKLVGALFERALSRDLCSPVSFEKGFLPVVELLDDIAIEAPKTFSLMATMVKDAKLGEEL